MMRDLALLLWLRWRHLRGRAQYWAALTGANLQEASITERAYEFYLVLLFGGWFAMMMGIAADGARGIGADAGPAALSALTLAALLLPSTLLAILGARALRSSPVKLTFADVAYVGASALDTRAVALSSAVREAVPAALIAGPLGYLVGSIAVGAGAGANTPWASAAMAALVTVAVLLVSWAAGLARVRFTHHPWPAGTWIAAPVAAAALGFVLVTSRWTGVLARSPLDEAGVGYVIASVAFIGIGVAALLVSATRMDMVAVIEESALFAQLQVFRPLQVYDPVAYADIVRRKRLSLRQPRWQMPSGSGSLALIARACVSHVRQPGSLVTPLIWGAAIVPYVAGFALSPHRFLAYFPAVFVFVVGPYRQLLHVFGQDADRPSLREMLPFGNLQLVLVDSVPVLALMAASSIGVAAVFRGGTDAGLALAALSVLLGVAVVLCAALERLVTGGMRNPIGYGITATITIVAVMYAGSTGSPTVACLTAMAIVVTLALLVNSARQ